MQKTLLILDLDETVVFATEQKLAREEDFRVAQYFVYKRPGLNRFITFVLEHFKVAVWTASGSAYADAIVDGIFGGVEQLAFAWSRQRCTWRTNSDLQIGYWVKDLKKVRRLGHSLNKVVVVDDSSRKLERSYGNHIPVLPFRGDAVDNELEELEHYLLWLKSVPDVRSVDKRSWKSTVPMLRKTV
jgi:RNA polymerase II subunit A small phosphatase-like protein